MGFPLHSYSLQGQKAGYSERYLRILRERLEALSPNAPQLLTLNHLAITTDTPFEYLHSIVSRRRDPYRTFNMTKMSGGFRVITVPETLLMHIQRWIHKNILSLQTLHHSSTAYAPRCTPYGNSAAHCGAKWLVKMDIVNFFESISEIQIFKYFKGLGYSPLLAFEFSRLCTKTHKCSRKYYKSKRWVANRKYKFYFNEHNLRSWHIGHLPQGAPTSPMLANICCKNLDEELYALAKNHGCCYTRYSDDITFSSVDLGRERSKKIIKDASIVLARFGFLNNLRKTKIIPPGAKKIVTGLLVDTDKPRLTKEFKANLKNHLYYAGKFGVADHCLRVGFKSVIGFKNHIFGLISYAESVDSEFGQRCLSLFKKIQWLDKYEPM